MFVDSHCHLSAAPLFSQINQVLERMAVAQVTRALCVSTSIADFKNVQQLISQYQCLWASAGVHPNEPKEEQFAKDQLIEQASHAKVIGIGETGLDYYRHQNASVKNMQWQHERFHIHIEAAQETGLPLIIHTRNAANDTLAVLKAAASQPGNLSGVFHCFSENLGIAKQVLDLGFYIPFSGILTFKSAVELREVAKAIPKDACLIETDSPYLAPMPYRGKLNIPSYVPYVAATLADLWQSNVEQVAAQTMHNFEQLFKKVKTSS